MSHVTPPEALSRLLVSVAILGQHPDRHVGVIADAMGILLSELVAGLIGDAATTGLLNDAIPVANKDLEPIGLRVETRASMEAEAAAVAEEFFNRMRSTQ
jgi:hypothetical protein